MRSGRIEYRRRRSRCHPTAGSQFPVFCRSVFEPAEHGPKRAANQHGPLRAGPQPKAPLNSNAKLSFENSPADSPHLNKTLIPVVLCLTRGCSVCLPELLGASRSKGIHLEVRRIIVFPCPASAPFKAAPLHYPPDGAEVWRALTDVHGIS